MNKTITDIAVDLFIVEDAAGNKDAYPIFDRYEDEDGEEKGFYHTIIGNTSSPRNIKNIYVGDIEVGKAIKYCDSLNCTGYSTSIFISDFDVTVYIK